MRTFRRGFVGKKRLGEEGMWMGLARVSVPMVMTRRAWYVSALVVCDKMHLKDMDLDVDHLDQLRSEV